MCITNNSGMNKIIIIVFFIRVSFWDMESEGADNEILMTTVAFFLKWIKVLMKNCYFFAYNIVINMKITKLKT